MQVDRKLTLARDRRRHVAGREVFTGVESDGGGGGVGGARRHGLVADGVRGLAGRGAAAADAGRALVLLSPVAEPDAHDLAVEPQRRRQTRHLVGARLSLAPERRLQRFPQRRVDARLHHDGISVREKYSLFHTTLEKEIN